jgi:hypothetical protein
MYNVLLGKKVQFAEEAVIWTNLIPNIFVFYIEKQFLSRVLKSAKMPVRARIDEYI